MFKRDLIPTNANPQPPPYLDRCLQLGQRFLNHATGISLITYRFAGQPRLLDHPREEGVLSGTQPCELRL